MTAASIYPASYSAVEVAEGLPTVPAVAWVRGGTRQVQVTFRNPSATPHTVGVVTDAGSYTDFTTSSIISVAASPTSLNFAAYGEATVTYTLTGLPNYVAKGTLQVPIEFTNPISGYPTGFSHTVYLTYSTPSSLQSTVWTNVLDDACTWAFTKTTAENCREETTRSLYRSGVFLYNPNGLFYTVAALDSESLDYEVRYRLKGLFADRAIASLLSGDCRDVSNYLLTMWQALGVSGSIKLVADNSDTLAFETHPLCGIGNTWTDPTNYIKYSFNFHQVTMSGTDVYDVAAAQLTNLTGGAYNDTPIAWPLSGYWQTVNPSPPPGGSGFLGLTLRYIPGGPVPQGQTVGITTGAATIIGYDNS